MNRVFVLIYGIIVLTTNGISEQVEGPVFVEEPPSSLSFLYIRGGAVPCSAHGTPSPTVTWHFQDGTLVTEVEGLRKINTFGALEFPAIVDSQYDESIHSTVYVCYAANEAGVIRSRDVTVNGVPSQAYSISLHDEVAMRGNTVVFKCDIPSFVKDYVEVTSWTRDNVPITAGGRFSILQTGELHIRELTPDDGQFTYRCNIIDTFIGRTDQAQASLTVVEPVTARPRIINSQASLTMLVGETVEIPCVASGHPLPVYSWKKDDVEVEHESRMSMRGGNLVISDLNILDEGDYTCEVRNRQGTEIANVHLSVREPISVYFYPHHRTVDIGDPAYFNCSVTGHPVDTVTWYKDTILLDGLPGITIFDNGTMMVDEMRRGDQGMYQCVAGNRWEYQEATMQLSLGAAAPSIVDGFGDDVLHPGPDVHLMCVVAGNPPPVVSWFLDGEQVLQNRRVAINQIINVDRDVVSYLNITRSKVQDGGTYRCQASNINGEIDHQARINIYGPPIIRKFNNITAVAGGIMVVQCIAAGYPINDFKWYKDNNLLPSNGRQAVEADGTLRINDVKKNADGGEYSCEVDNGLGQSDIKSVYIDVIVPPKIAPMPKISLLEGDRMQMLCSMTSGDAPISIAWLKDDHPIPANIGVIIHSVGASSLLYADVVTTDLAGNYTCVANNSAATVTYTNEVFIFVSPSFIVYPVDTSVILNYTATLYCNASGYPEPDITWKRTLDFGSSNFIEITEDERISVKKNGELVIEQVTEEDDGRYLCSINNTVGEDSRTALLTVYIPARFKVAEVNMTAKLNEEVILECHPDGHGDLEIDWYKNDVIYTSLLGKDYQINTEQGKEVNSKLRILKATRGDTAVYTCQARNSYGSDTHTIHLTILEPPESPINVREVGITSRSFTIEWEPGFDGNSAITGYTIEYKNDSDVWQGGVPRIHVLGNLTTLRYTVTDLHPAYVYVIRIKSFNAISISPFSDEVLIKTLEEVPSGQPLNIEISALSSTTIRLVWRQPRADLQNGDILGYYIRYKEIGSSTPSQSVMTSSITNYIESYTLERLRKFTEYTVEIAAFNEIGSGPWSQQKNIMTLEDVPSEAPPSIQATPLGSTVIRVMWSTLPLDSIFGILQGYKVFYKPIREDEDEADLLVKETTALSTDLVGLDKFTNYSIRVLAFTRIGDGVRSEEIHIMTNQDYPSMPADIKAHAHTSTSVMVSWLPPLQLNGILQKYILTMIRNTDTETVLSNFTLGSNFTNYLIENLETYVEYNFYVRAATIVGAGVASNIATEIPLPRVPARIMSFSRTMIITWKTDVTLECMAVGEPTPLVHWRKEGAHGSIASGEDYGLLPSGELVIYHTMPNDKGRYICQASNNWGSSEEIHVDLNVLVSQPIGTPPAAPIMEIVSSTSNSIQISWISKSNGGSVLLGFNLFYKKENDFLWVSVSVNSTTRSFIFTDLQCGTPYQFYMTANNKLGTSDDSNVINQRTTGSTPIAPSTDMILLETNATLVSLNLGSFDSGGCPIKSFTVQHKLFGQDIWKTKASNIPAPSDVFIVDELHPSTWYVLRVTAINSAGPTSYDIRVATVSYTGGTVPPLVLEHKPQEQGLPYYSDPKIFVPVLGGLIVFILLCIVAIVLYRHTNYWKTKQATTISADGCMMTIDMDSNLRREDSGAPYEHEPFLGEGGTPLNNLNNSTKNWIFSPNDDIDACHSVNLPVSDPNIKSSDPNIKSISPVSFTTFNYPSSQESTQGAVGGVFYASHDSPYHNITPRIPFDNGNLTYDQLTIFQKSCPPPLPERPPHLYSNTRTQSIRDSQNIAKQNISISRNSIDTFSSNQEERSYNYQTRRHGSSKKNETLYKSVDTHSSSNSDLELGIWNLMASPSDVQRDTDSSSPEQIHKQGARPRERLVRSQTIHSSDGSDDQADGRYSKCYRPARTKGGKGSRKPNSATKPPRKSKRANGKPKRHGRRSHTSNPTTSAQAINQSCPIDGYASSQYADQTHHHSSIFFNDGMRYYETRINGFLSEPEQPSRSTRKHHPRRQASTPSPQLNIGSTPVISTVCVSKSDRHKRLPRSHQVSTEDSTDHNGEIEIEMVSPDQLSNTSENAYLEEFTIV